MDDYDRSFEVFYQSGKILICIAFLRDEYRENKGSDLLGANGEMFHHYL